MKSVKLYPLNKPVTKTIEISGSKSYTNRALLIAALTENSVKIINPLFSDDTKAMIDSLTKLGIEINISSKLIQVNGSLKDIYDGEHLVDTNLAATVIRFLLPLLAVVPGIKIIEGKEGLNKRPIADLVNALRQLGANIEYLDKEGFPPLRISSSKLNPGNVELDGRVSSQFLSALFMIAPMIGGMTIEVMGKQISKPYIDMTIDCMKKFGVKVINKNYQRYEILPNQEYKIDEYAVEGDFSSAGYFFAVATLTESTITIKNLNPESVQADRKILKVLSQMGNVVTFGADEITIKGNGVKSAVIDMLDFPDQAQTLAVLAAFAKGATLLTGIQSLHVKETDRVKATAAGLKKMGISTESTFDTITIHGGNPKPAKIDTYGDQRTAMSFAIAGAKISGMEINDPDVVNKTFPDFWKKLEEVGIKAEEIK